MNQSTENKPRGWFLKPKNYQNEINYQNEKTNCALFVGETFESLMHTSVITGIVLTSDDGSSSSSSLSKPIINNYHS